MSLFDIRPGIEESGLEDDKNENLPKEANLQGLCAALATDYARLIKERVLTRIDNPVPYKIRDFQVLMAIYNAKEVLTASHIYKSTGLDPATVTRSVKLLTLHGHLMAEENEADTRSRFLLKTDKGEQLAKAYRQACRDIFIPKTEGSPFAVADTELSALMSALVVLRQRVNILRQLTD